MLFKDLPQLGWITNHVVVIGIRQVVEWNIYCSRHVALGNSSNGDTTSAMEAAISSHVNHGPLCQPVLVVSYTLLYVVESTDNVVVYIGFEFSRLLYFFYRTRFEGIFFSDPTSNTAIHNMYASILVKNLEHKPRSRRAIKTLRIIKDDFICITYSKRLHSFLKLGNSRKFLQQGALLRTYFTQVQVLRIRKSPLTVRKKRKKTHLQKLLLRILLRGNMASRINNLYRA